MTTMAYSVFGYTILSLLVALICAEEVVVSSPFKIVIDGGSTGSRLHVYEFVESTAPALPTDASICEGRTDCEPDKEVVVECVRRGSSRANIPLSAFGREGDSDAVRLPLNASHIAEHMLPLFEDAAQVIPPEFHSTTPVRYQATAGMRLLEISEQEAVYDALYQGLMESPRFRFGSMSRGDIQTLGGELEGFYGAVAANYLQGIVDAQLRLVEDEMEGSNGPVGALDMGGSSTQIVFLPDAQPNRSKPRKMDKTNARSSTERLSSQVQLNGDHFFSTSYLSYGVDQFRERLWSALVEESKEQDQHLPEPSATVPNPCANVGYRVDWEGRTLVGTGDAQECVRQTKRLIPSPDSTSDDFSSNLVGGIEHPPVRGKFLAMSLFFFSLDSLRVFSQPDQAAHAALNLSWPNPSISELHNALDGLCSRDWETDMATQVGVHTFSREEVLPHRCFETTYMVTLLKDGFGFHPESRDITFTFLVEGSEVEWTLGMALSMYGEETSLDSSTVTESSETNATYETHGQKSGSPQPFRVQSVAHPMFLADSL